MIDQSFSVEILIKMSSKRRLFQKVPVLENP